MLNVHVAIHYIHKLLFYRKCSTVAIRQLLSISKHLPNLWDYQVTVPQKERRRRGNQNRRCGADEQEKATLRMGGK